MLSARRPFRRAGDRRRDPAARGLLADCRLEDRCLLAATASSPLYAFPAPTVSSLSQVMYNGVTGTYTKTITITNNDPTKYLYAFLEGSNTRQAVGQYAGMAAFDPYDPSKQEYRGYVGFSQGGTDYAGLPPLTSITITVPLAFWDSGRILFSTDGADQFQTYGTTASGAPAGAPFYFQYANTQFTFFGTIDPSDPTHLKFTPVYNNFDANGNPLPDNSTPVSTGLFFNGETLSVVVGTTTYTATVNSSDPSELTLSGPVNGGITTPTAFTFTLVPSPPGSPQVLAPTTARYIQGGFPLTTNRSSPTTTNNGVVMWYHAFYAVSPNNDAPFQLTEFTFRGTFYDSSPNAGTYFEDLIGSDVYPGVIGDSADYDLSFVDTINLPVALEATNASVGNTGVQEPFGWVGSNQSIEQFQAALTAFASPNSAGANTNFLGQYFGGQGYRSYVPVDPGDVKLPAGQNLFLASPLAPSSGTADVFYYKTFSSGPPIQEPLYALTTNPAGQSTPLPASLAIGGVPDTPPFAPTSGPNLALNTLTLANQYILDQIIANNYKTQNYVVTYKDASGKTVVAGTIVGMYTYQGQIAGVELNQNAPVDPKGNNVYTISSANFDYAAGTIAGLWYSWAKYYAMHETSNPPPDGAPGTIAAGSNVLTLNAATSGLVPGMAVTATAAGLPPGAVILSVGTDNKTITLSVAPTVTLTGVTFKFAAPSLSAIAGFDSTQTPLVNLNFSNVSADEQATALDFAQTVYVCMSAWSTSVQSTPGAAPGWIQLLTNVIGGNLNTVFLPNANVNVVNTLTDMSKSALRGVPDFTSPLYSDPAQWYPDPSLATGGLAYNAFNLDPYVWFVHDKLGLTAYGFALDDDIGNVNAGGATNIAFAVGGLTGLPNQDPYTNVSQFGVVQATASNTTKLSSQLSGLTGPNPVGSGVFAQIQAYDYDHATPGTLINGPGVAPGTTVQFTNLTPNLTGSTIDLSNPLSASTTSPSYSFFGTLVFRATLPGPPQSDDTIIVDAQAAASLAKLGPLGNIQVDGEGIDPAHPLTIDGTPVKNPDGSYTITLSGDLDPKLVSVPGSYYAYRFGLPATGVIHDPGFEWRDVSVAAGDFNHGKQLSAITPDWTFTDSTTNTNWYAGIAFGNQNIYTMDNPPAPQGLQVGFIQGDSSISQKVTLAKGRYVLSLVAAQRAKAGQPAQTLDVYLGNTLEGTITPADTKYKPWSIKIDVPATGEYTLTFKGATAADSTALIDSVGLAPVSPSLAAAPPISLGTIPNQVTSDGSTDTFTAQASGLTEPLTYSLAAGAPPGAEINPVTGVFTWTPKVPGIYDVTVDVADDSLPPLTAEQTVTITVPKATSHAVAVANLAAPVYGQSQLFGAAVATVPALGVPTGMLQFYVDGVKFGSPVQMVNGAAISPSIVTLGAGVHHVAAVYSGDANYASSATPVLTETIARAPLLVVANDSARVFGQPNPLLTASYYGFVNGDTPASLTSPTVVATLANQFSPVGTYGIDVAGATSPNYAITFQAGTLTVLPTPAGATRQRLADSAFVTTLYEEILGRNPDVAGFDFWVQMLARGVSGAAVASAFWNSPEHRVLVASGRAPLIPQAVVLHDAQTAARIAFLLGASAPAGPLG
jgi:hypothetical protein